ncbi:hypothetical protein [Stenotrophomonas muris]|uniref:hypothetical protein n=1 Tax=Stenotrophomonas muris TaxID=2963283 RepID=UPI002E75B810|nr:hypothetical protein [Stenotrophomonas muris]
MNGGKAYSGNNVLWLAPGSGGPHHPNMENRVTKLESIVATLPTKADVEGLRADLHKMDASITRWMIATVIALFLGFAGLFFTMSSTINGALERATKPATYEPRISAAPQPIIIQMPPQPQAAATQAPPPPAKR